MGQNKKTIFISYGRDEENPQDVELVQRIKKDLEKDFEVLIDEEQLRTTNDWETKLENMILKSDWILFFITPYSARRSEKENVGFCLNELAMSQAYKKPVAPVMVRYIVPPLQICRLQYLDLQKLKNNNDYDKKIEEIIGVLSGEKELGFEGEHLNISNKLDPIKFETVIAKHIHGFTGREWVKDEVDDWLSQKKDSRVLWITAEAGFGKSAIATYLAKEHPSAMSIYFCRYDYSESKDPREMLKVLIYELSTQLVEYNRVLQTLNIEKILRGSAEHIFRQLLLEPLYMIQDPEEKRFFIIDALDEAVENGENKIAELISNRFSELPSWLNVVITSRPEPELSKKLKKFDPVELKANDDRNLTDIKEYLTKHRKIEDPAIIEALAKKSEGNILYLKSIFELDMIKKKDLTVENIHELPPSMEGFYLTYFERKFIDSELYEEKYLEFVSLLVVSEGLPELLIQDILELSERQYKKLKSSFGSLLEIDKEHLTFYHKSIYEWLGDYDKSGDYSADIEMGREKLQAFMDSLTAESYKEEYLDFELFSRILIDNIYVKEKSLNRFFELISSIRNLEKIVNVLDELAQYFYVHENIQSAIELYEKNLHILQVLYIEDFELLEENYIVALNNLATAYQKVNRVSSAIELLEKSLNILSPLYIKNPEYWTSGYINALNNLAASYESINRTSKVLELNEKGLNILKGLYEENSAQWVDMYTMTLINSAFYCARINRTSEAVNYLDESLNIIKPLYVENPEHWGESYSQVLGNLAIAYANTNVSKSIEFLEESLSIIQPLYIDNSERWVSNYARTLINLANSYEQVNKVSKALELREESLNILEPLYVEHSDRWVEFYVNALSSLASSYDNSHKVSEAIELYEKSLNILRPLYMENPERWVKTYTEILNDFAVTCSNSNRVSRAIALLEESVKIRESFYIENPELWNKSYNFAIDHLFRVYKEAKYFEKAKKLKKESRVILQKYKVVYRQEKKENSLGRNDVCDCGSGKKYKKCHGKNE